MRSLALLAALVTVLLGAEGNGSAAAEDPLVCCLPGQWQATKVHSYVSVRNRRFRFGKVVSHVAHDNIKGREVYFTTRSDNLGPERTLVYYLSNEERIMYVYNNATGKCIKQEMGKPFSECCVPASAVMEDQELVYGEGSSNVTAFRVSFSVPRSRGPDLSISVTATDKCVPIVEQFTWFLGTRRGLDVETAEYIDMKIGEVPDHLFHRPQACCKASFQRPKVYPSISFDF